MADAFLIRTIAPHDDNAVAAIIRGVMAEFGAVGTGFAINDPEVDWMCRAYRSPRSTYFVVDRNGAGREAAAWRHWSVATPRPANCARCISCPSCGGWARAAR